MKNKTLLISIVLLALSGCATPPLSLNYGPTSTLSVSGQVSVGDFKYRPGEEGGKIKANQIRNTALGSIIFEKNINEYIETALFLESRFVGIKLGDQYPKVYGEINEFLIDDLGFSVDWTLDIRYIIEACYDQEHVLQKKTDKFGDIFGTLNDVIKLNIEMLFEDPAFQACIGSANQVLLDPIEDFSTTPIGASKSGDSTLQGNLIVMQTTKPETRYPDIVENLNSSDSFRMRDAAKSAGERRLYKDKGIITACIGVLERASETLVDKKDKFKIDGIAWCSLNLGYAGVKSAVPILTVLSKSQQPKKIIKHADQALKSIGG